MNKPKVGLKYFPFETQFFGDIKTRKLIKYQGSKAIPVYILLLCDIYDKGYYMRWDKDLPFIISEKTGYEEGYINEVIKCCISVGLFSKQIWDSHKVLTSKGIQDRYELICKQLKRKFEISEFSLNSSEYLNNPSEVLLINTEEKTQSKRKEIKGKEKKENEIKKSDEQIFSDLKEKIFNSNVWIEDISRNYKISLPVVLKNLEEFLNELRLKEDFFKPLNEVRRHFINWLKVILEKEKKVSKNANFSKTEKLIEDAEQVKNYFANEPTDSQNSEY